MQRVGKVGDMKKQSFGITDLLLIWVACLWGLHPLFIKMGIGYLPMAIFNPLRMAVAAITALVILWGSKEYQKMSFKDFAKVMGLGICGFFFYQYCFGMGSTMTTSGNVSFIFALVPVSIALLNVVINHEKIGLMTMLGICISVVGVMVIITGSGQNIVFSGENLKGIGMVFVAQLAFALFTVYSGELSKKYSSNQITSYCIVITALLFIMISSRELIAFDYSTLSGGAWLSALLSGGLAVSMGSCLWTWGAKRLGSTKAALYNNFPPIFTMVAVYIVDGETFTMIQILGAAMIFIGLYVAKSKQKENHVEVKTGKIAS